MSGELKLVLFDCDGTLVDSQHMIVAAMNEAFTQNGLALLPRGEVLSIVGLSLENAIAALLPEQDPGTLVRVTEAYRDAFTTLRGRPDLHEPLFEGAREALDWLRKEEDVLLGIVTGKSQKGLRNILALHELSDYFITLQTADDAPSKPHPGMIERALGETGARADHTVVIGDTSYDMLMARSAGAHGLGVAWGYHEPTALSASGARRILQRFGETEEALGTLWAEWQGKTLNGKEAAE